MTGGFLGAPSGDDSSAKRRSSSDVTDEREDGFIFDGDRAEAPDGGYPARYGAARLGSRGPDRDENLTDVLASGSDALERSDLENLDAILGHEISENTRRSYETQWRLFANWARSKRVPALPADPVHVSVYLAERMEVHGHKPATLRSAAAAVSYAHKAAALNDPCASQGVRNALKSAARKAGREQRQAEALTAEALQKIRETARLPRSHRDGGMENTQAAVRRGLTDIAIVALMRDAMLRVSEAASLRWSDLHAEPDGTGRILIRRSKTDAEGETAVLFVSGSTMSDLESMRAAADTSDTIFALSANQISRRIKSAAQAAGLGDGFSGHSPRVGMAQDLARAGTELPRLMTAGRWRSPRMPAHYIRNETAARGAVAQYYGSTAELTPTGSRNEERYREVGDGMCENGLQLLRDSIKIARENTAGSSGEKANNGAKIPIKATINDTSPSSSELASVPRLGGEKQGGSSAAPSGTEGYGEPHRFSLITDTTCLSPRVFERHQARLFALNRTFGAVHHRFRPLFRAFEAVSTRPLLAYVMLRSLPLAVCILVVGYCLSSLDWSETWVPAMYVCTAMALVLVHPRVFPTRNVGPRDFYWISVFVVLSTPMLQFASIGMDQYGFYRIEGLAGTHMQYMFALLVNFVLASGAGLMFHLMQQRHRPTGGGVGNALKRAGLVAARPLGIVYVVVLFISSASVWIQILLVLPVLALAFTLLQVLRDPSVEFSDREKRFFRNTSVSSIAIAYIVGIVVIATSYSSPSVSQILPDHNLIQSWQIDFTDWGFSREDALDRLKLGYLLHGTIALAYMTFVVVGQVVIASFNVGGGGSPQRVRDDALSTTASDADEDPLEEREAPKRRNFSLGVAGNRMFARSLRMAERYRKLRV